MKGLIKFLSRFSILFLFVILELVAFNIMSSKTNMQRVKMLSATSDLVGSVNSINDNIAEYFSLKLYNTELSDENAMLRNELEKYKQKIADGSYYSNNVGIAPANPVLIDSISNITQASDTVKQQQMELDLSIDSIVVRFSYIPARIISNSHIRQNNFFTINKGFKDGIKKEMGVVGPDGVVGIITGLSNNYATGSSLLNTRWSVSSKIKNTNYFGTLVWNGKSPKFAKLNEIAYHVELNKGDTIVTSGYSDVFPEGIDIGTVEKVDHTGGGNFLDIEIKLLTNFENVSYVTVVVNKDVEEIKKLKEETSNNE